jgi:hypothetical protein
MFDKLSRYRDVPEVAVPDARNRVVAAADIRQLPEVTGTFKHTVVAGNRLDQLANLYYGQPERYWRICDANPQPLSPLALVDQDTVVTRRFPLTVADGTAPPWRALRQTLDGTLGIEAVAVVEDVQPLAQLHDEVNPPYTAFVDQVSLAVEVTYNRVTVDAEDLLGLIASVGFTVGRALELGQLGREIVIPVAVTG